MKKLQAAEPTTVAPVVAMLLQPMQMNKRRAHVRKAGEGMKAYNACEWQMPWRGLPVMILAATISVQMRIIWKAEAWPTMRKAAKLNSVKLRRAFVLCHYVRSAIPIHRK